MTETLVLFGHLLVAGLIIALVLLQRGKGAEAGTGFGAGASGTVFGSRGSASFFSRATAVLAGLFFATSLALAYFSTQATAPESLVEGAGADSAVIQGLGDAESDVSELAEGRESEADSAADDEGSLGEVPLADEPGSTEP
jgi:preprotein translocase subunit SecG